MLWQDAVAPESCSPDGAMLGGVKMGSGLTGKLGRAWLVHGCMVVVGDVVGVELLHVYTTWIGDVELGVGYSSLFFFLSIGYSSLLFKW